MIRKVHLACVATICVLVLAFGASTAAAQTGSAQGYDETGTLGTIDQGGGGGSAPQTVAATDSATDSGGGSLPFTGLDVGIVLLLGGAAVGTGLVLRRVVRTPTQ